MSPREQRLALAVMALFLFGGGWLVFSQMGRWKKSIEDREYKLSLKKTEADELLKQKDFWHTRADWLDQKLEPYPTRNEADNRVYELVDTTAKKQGLTIQRQLAEPEEQSGLTAATVIVEAKGPLEKVLRWLYDLQKPANFISIKGMSVKTNQEDSNLVIVSELKIQKWYRNVLK